MTYLELIQAFRDRVERQEQSAVDEINEYYLPVLKRIIADFESVVGTIALLQSEGRRVSRQLIYNQTRYLAIITQLTDEIAKANKLAIETISLAQRRVVEQAIDDSRRLITDSMGRIPTDVNFDAAFLRFDEKAVKQMIARLSEGTPLRQILEANVPDIMRVSEAFVDAMVRGLHARELAKQLYTQWGMSRVRAETTARTEVISSYRDANIERYQQSKTVQAWEWSATLDDRTCPVCVFMDGQIFSLDTPFATHPNCRCSPIPVTKTWKELGIDAPDFKPDTGLHGEEWFEAQDDETQLTILHPKKYELYKAGEMTLKDLTRYFVHPKYGPSREERSIKEMKRLGIIE